MGHTPQVADKHYLECTDEIRRNATFVGEALPDMYRGADSTGTGKPAEGQKVIAIHPLQNTPVGRCKDTLHGEFAPKDGTHHCLDFFSCFKCHSYAVVGTLKDLHRLFSFYWFLDRERQRIGSREWAEEFMVIMTLIDAFTRDKFDAKLVAEAKELARIEPLKFWKNYQLTGEADNGAA
jgi:hypothetical protein